MFDLSYEEAIAKAEHLRALGETTVFLRNDKGFPYSKVTDVVGGSTYRLSGPTSCRLIAEVEGLQFQMSVDFEDPEANGKGISLFDRERLRGLMLKLPAPARERFARLLEHEILAGLQKRQNELLMAFDQQSDTVDCVRGLIAFAREAA